MNVDVVDVLTVLCLGLVALGMVPTLASFAQFVIVGAHGIWNHYSRCRDYTPRVAFVLRTDLYAVAALAAGAVVTLGSELDLPPAWTMLAGAALCIFLRLMAIFYGWRAPVARWVGKAGE